MEAISVLLLYLVLTWQYMQYLCPGLELFPTSNSFENAFSG